MRKSKTLLQNGIFQVKSFFMLINKKLQNDKCEICQKRETLILNQYQQQQESKQEKSGLERKKRIREINNRQVLKKWRIQKPVKQTQSQGVQSEQDQDDYRSNQEDHLPLKQVAQGNKKDIQMPSDMEQIEKIRKINEEQFVQKIYDIYFDKSANFNCKTLQFQVEDDLKQDQIEAQKTLQEPQTIQEVQIQDSQDELHVQNQDQAQMEVVDWKVKFPKRSSFFTSEDVVKIMKKATTTVRLIPQAKQKQEVSQNQLSTQNQEEDNQIIQQNDQRSNEQQQFQQDILGRETNEQKGFLFTQQALFTLGPQDQKQPEKLDRFGKPLRILQRKKQLFC